MKHFITTILFLATLTTGYSQITLDHAFNLSTSLHYFSSDSHGLMYYEEEIDTTTNSFKIYNSDYSIYKTVTLPRPIGAYGAIYLCSEKLFNTDNLLEFICVYILKNGNVQFIAYNENAIQIKDFGNTYNSPNSPLIITHNSTSKLLFNYYKNDKHVYEIYSLPGNFPSQVSETKTSSIKSAYPNPSNTSISIPYSIDSESTSLKIYDLNGTEVENKSITSSNNKVDIDIRNYKTGIYIYEYNGNTGRFIKQ